MPATPASAPARTRVRASIAFLAQENLPVPPPPAGGSIARVVYELARELAGSFDVTVCSLPHPSYGDGIHGGVRYVRVSERLDGVLHGTTRQAVRVLRRLDLPHPELQGLPFYARGYATGGLRRLAALAPDVVHLQNVSQFLPLARRLLPDALLVLHMHCDWLRELPPDVVRRRLRHADLVLGVSDYVTDRIREGFPEYADRCATLLNGVRLESFPPRERLWRDARARLETLRAELGAGDGPVVLSVGSLAPEKGTDVLLAAAGSLGARLPGTTVVLAGSHVRYFRVAAPRGRGERRCLRLRQSRFPERLTQLAAAAGRAGTRVVFAGAVPHDELPAYYALADVVVVPSSEPEPFGLPVLEAGASAVPVIASACGGLPGIVRHRVNGILVPPGDEGALANALVEVCGDATLARSLGAAGAEAAGHLTWAAQAESLAELYRARLAQPRPVP